MILALSFVAMACLCLSMVRHQRDLFSRPLNRGWSRMMRCTGFTLILIAGAMAGVEGSVRLLGWIGEVTAVMMFIVLGVSLAGAVMNKKAS